VCTVTNLVTGEVVLVTKRYKNIYVADFESLQAGDMSCLKKDLVRGLPNSNFKEHRVCDACAKGNI